MNEEQIFHEAIAHNPADRAAYLDRVCAGNPAVRASVEALLRANVGASGFLSHAMPGLTVDLPFVAERPGTQIGPYKLLQQLGEGGMGTVFMAEQTQPVQRRVALKVIKPGMDSAQVIARFEAERQALAMMDHVNIARVLDAATTENGRPYFVMELVHGVPITKYCDDNHLTPRQRLELFVPVCNAIQHAHQKGIIHRDIKPSNVMVTLYDGKPVPKVIDFGVAKATEQKLTERTLFTQYGTMVGTLEYMSPEQAEMSALGVDTRSDIYSLGVLLYELLTGSTPLSRQRMKEAAHAEILRMIKEEEPPKPSTRLSDSGEALASISANRQTEPAKLTKLVKGELDWIVMKCLEKDRSRRYETANGFAADVQRYLNDEPVQACPPTALYSFRKFARRNKAALATTAALGLALLLAVSAIGWAVRDRSARENEAKQAQVARQVRVAGQVQLILDEVARLEREQKWPEAMDTARRASDLLTGSEVEAELAGQVQDTIRTLELVRLLEVIRADKSEWNESEFDFRGTAERYAAAFRDCGIDLGRLKAEEAARRVQSRPAVLAALAPALDDWAWCYHDAGDARGAQSVLKVAGLVDPDPWRQQVRQALGTRDQTALLTLAAAPDLARQPAATLTMLGVTLTKMNRVDAAIGVLSLARRQYPSDFWVHFEMALALVSKGPPSLEQAAGCYRTALGLRPRNPATWNNLGNLLWEQGKPDEAIDCLNKAIELDPKLANAHHNLGLYLFKQQKLDDAIVCLNKAIELDPKIATIHNVLGNVLHQQKKFDDAIARYHKAIALNPKYAGTHCNLGIALSQQGMLDDAIACFSKAVELDPRFVQAHYNRGVVLLAQKKLDDAIACFNRTVELDPKYALAHYNKGVALAAQRKIDEAIACFNKAIELDPKYTRAHTNLGLALAGQKKLDEAIACYRKAIELDPKQEAAYLQLASLFEIKGQHDEAITTLEEAIRLLPRRASPANNLAWLLANCRDPKFRNAARAVELAEKTVEFAPANPGYQNTLGVAHCRAGNWKVAIEALNKSIKLSKGGDSADCFFLAMAHCQLGDKQTARKWYDQAVEWTDKNQPKNEELRRFQAEADEMLGVEPKKD